MKRNRGKMAGLVIATALCTALASGTVMAESSDEVYKIGFFCPLSGGNAEYGSQDLNAVQLYVDNINANGGWFGHQLEVVAYDDQADPTTALAVCTKLIEEDQVQAICGTIMSSCLVPCLEIIEEAGIPVFTGGTSSSFSDSSYIYRSTVCTDFSTEPILKWMSENEYSTIAIFSQDDDASVDAGNACEEYAAQYGIEVVGREICSGDDTDYTGQCANLTSVEPDAIYFACNGTQMTQFIKQIRAYGYDGLCFNKEGIQMFTIDICGDATNNTAFAWPTCTFSAVEEAPEGTEMRNFLEQYYEVYGKMPTSDCAFRGWDAMLLLDAAVNYAGEYTREAVAQALYNMDPIEGANGLYDFKEGCADGITTVDRLWYIKDGSYYNLNSYAG